MNKHTITDGKIWVTATNPRFPAVGVTLLTDRTFKKALRNSQLS